MCWIRVFFHIVFCVYLYEKGCHSFRCVVVARNAVDHSNGIEKSSQTLHHGYRVSSVQRLTILLQGVEVLHIVSSFIGIVSDLLVKLLPFLKSTTKQLSVRFCLTDHLYHSIFTLYLIFRPKGLYQNMKTYKISTFCFVIKWITYKGWSKITWTLAAKLTFINVLP